MGERVVDGGLEAGGGEGVGQGGDSGSGLMGRSSIAAGGRLRRLAQVVPR
jgi:hypothetical protein